MEEESYIYIDSRSRSASPEGQVSNTFLTQFITTYESLPSLWDRTDPNYLNKRKRNEGLDRLAKILRNLKPYATREDARKKVNSLRSNYRKELVKIERSKRSSVGAAEVYKPKSTTFHMLKFLAKIEKAALSQSYTDEDGDDKINNSFISYQNEDPLINRRKIVKRAKIKRNEITKPCLIRPAQTQPVDLVEPIALVWSEKIKNLSPAQRLHVEKAINDILYEAELQNLNESNQTASPASFTSSPVADKSKPDLVIGKEEL